ncbi:MAG: ECF transporter S component [Clostridia bacterium]|nr:ECF transporter S component [Clostridia bacterium]
MQRSDNKTLRICFIGIIAAMIMIINYLTPIPFLGTKLRFSNALCALAGLLLGPWTGLVAAGLGSALYDAIAGYTILEMGITFISKGAIAMVAGLLAAKVIRKQEIAGKDFVWVVISCALGALTNVALYMLKTYLFGLYMKGFTLDATLVDMATKLPGSLINAAFATIVAPIVYQAVRKPLRKIGVVGEVSVVK